MSQEFPTKLSTTAIHDWLAAKQQIAIIWSVEDVQFLRSDLARDARDQAWHVLKECSRFHDYEVGINWTLLAIVAEEHYPRQEWLFDC